MSSWTGLLIGFIIGAFSGLIISAIATQHVEQEENTDDENNKYSE